MGINNVEVFIIGKRMNKRKLVCINLLSIFLGVVFGIFLKSLLISLFGGAFASVLVLFVFKSYYWVITPNGIFIPANSSFFKYLLVAYQYMILNDDKSKLIFIKYTEIKNLILYFNNDILKIKAFLKNKKEIKLNISKEKFNRDLVDGINYINNKGIKVINIEILKKLNINNVLKQSNN